MTDPLFHSASYERKVSGEVHGLSAASPLPPSSAGPLRHGYAVRLTQR
jgi:hypothetical protein